MIHLLTNRFNLKNLFTDKSVDKYSPAIRDYLGKLTSAELEEHHRAYRALGVLMEAESAARVTDAELDTANADA